MKKLFSILVIVLIFSCQENQDIVPQEILETDDMEVIEEVLFTCLIESYDDLDFELETPSEAIDQEVSPTHFELDEINSMIREKLKKTSLPIAEVPLK